MVCLHIILDDFSNTVIKIIDIISQISNSFFDICFFQSSKLTWCTILFLPLSTSVQFCSFLLVWFPGTMKSTIWQVFFMILNSYGYLSFDDNILMAGTERKQKICLDKVVKKQQEERTKRELKENCVLSLVKGTT